MKAALVSALLLLCLGTVSGGHRRPPYPFAQRGFGLDCAECGGDGGRCIRRPCGVCKYAASGGQCPQEICVPPYRTHPCAHGACPAGDRCTLDDKNRPLCDCSRCNTPDGGHCYRDEVCVPTESGGRQCVKVMNMHNGRFDGRNCKGVFVPCTSKADCRGWREPVEWACCTTPTRSPFAHKMTTRKGPQCDTRVLGCTVERYEFGKLRWALVQRKSEVDECNCHKTCPCCTAKRRRTGRRW